MLRKKTLSYLHSIYWSNVKIEIQIIHTDETLTTKTVVFQSLAYLRHAYTLLYASETNKFKVLFFFHKRELRTVA